MSEGKGKSEENELKKETSHERQRGRNEWTKKDTKRARDEL